MRKKQRRKNRSEIGAEIASARKAAGLSQQHVADILGIPQRTLSYYESKAGDLPSSLLVPLAKTLGVSVDELLGVKASPGTRSGARSQLERRIETIRKLPRKEQEFVLKFLDQVIDDHARRRRE